MNREEKWQLGKNANKSVKKIPEHSANPSSEQQNPTVHQSLDLAVQHHTSGRLPEAESIYQQVLQVDPNQPVALHMLGVIAHQVGKHDTAVDLIKKALAIKPDLAEAHNNLGSALKELGRLDEAVASIQKALDIKPDYAMAHNNLGNALKETNRLEDAIASYQKAIHLTPDNETAHRNLGLTFQELGRLDEAVASYYKALAIKPEYAEGHNNLGNALQEQGKLDEAVASYHKVLSIDPEYAEGHNHFGKALQELGKLDEAVASYHKAIAIKPDYAEAHGNLGNVLIELGRLDEAVSSFHKALAIKPDLAEAHNNLGGALQDLGKLDEAVFSYQNALSINPDYALAHNNLGKALQDLGKLDEAVTSYHNALTINPDFGLAHQNLGFSLLALRRDKQGLDELEWRWQIPGNGLKLRDFSQPMWDGTADLNNRSILLWSEQGIADTIKWASCLSQVIDQAGLCIVEVQPKLVSLLARSFPKAVVRAEDPDTQATDIDFHLPLGSLYQRLYPNIKFSTGAHLIPDSGRIAFWKKRLEELGPGPYIGICWKGSVITPVRALHYTQIEEWLPIFANRNAQFINLQSSGYEDDLARVERDFGVRVHNFEDLDLHDVLDDVAALSRALDIIISVSVTAVAIAAAVGAPTWQISWRQSQGGNNIIHAFRGPSITLFERNTGETWDGVFKAMAERLRAHLEKN